MLVVVWNLCLADFFEVCDYWILRAHLNFNSFLHTQINGGYMQDMEHFLCSPAACVIKAQH